MEFCLKRAWSFWGWGVIVLMVIGLGGCDRKPKQKEAPATQPAASKEMPSSTKAPASAERHDVRCSPSEMPNATAANDGLDPIANPNAKPGGTYKTWGSAFPKSLNMWLDYNALSGEITGLMFEPLASLHSTRNEAVGVLADSWTISEDKKTFTFHIHPKATWSDGHPITAEDVQFYYDVIMNPKNLTSIFRVGLDRFKRPEVVDEKTIRVSTDKAHWKNFWEAAGLTAFPKHIWEKVDFNKQKFDFPVVSGPYQLKELKKNRYVLLERRADWWGWEKPYNRYKYNFEHIRYKFIEDRTKALEAFKKGDFDVYPIYTASIWVKQTKMDTVKKGWVARQRVYNFQPRGFQGFAINLRRPLFQEKQLREALSYLIDRQLMNEKLMYNEYFLLNAYYPDLYPNSLSPNVPVRHYDSDKARKLLDAAGWTVNEEGVRVKEGKPLEITFLTAMHDQRHLNIYVEALKKVGIVVNIEKLSWASIRKRLDQHDFDLYWMSWGASRLRDPEPMWHSRTANEVATSNVSGVQSKAIDQLIEQQKTEMDLGKRNDILRQIDQHLTEIDPYVLLWQANHTRLLYWNKFGTPSHVLSKYGDEGAVIEYWWYDEAKEKALETSRKSNKALEQPQAIVCYQGE